MHWIVGMNWRKRMVFFTPLGFVFGARLLDLQAGAGAWVALLLHCLAYPQLAFWWARRQSSPARQRQVELGNMVLDTACFGFWGVALGFPVWLCFMMFVASCVSLLSFIGLSGIWHVAVGVGGGVGLGLLLVRPLVWLPDMSLTVTMLTMGTFIAVMAVFARDTFLRARSLYEGRKQMRQQLDEIQALQAQLREAAAHDSLTGLHNRRHLAEALPKALSRCARLKLPLTLVMIDIDFFKRINDTHGHAAGDEVLKALAHLLQGHVRQGDTACRMGGEEFLLVLENAGLEPAWERTQGLRIAFADQVVVHEGASLRATISCGLAMFPEAGSDAQSLLQAADRALYAAKAAGRNQLQSEVAPFV